MLSGIAAISSSLATLPVLGPRDYLLAFPPEARVTERTPGQFQASRADALEAKRALVAYLHTSHPDLPRNAAALRWSEMQRPAVAQAFDSYSLQYIGVSMKWTEQGGSPASPGDREVLIKGFCDAGLSATERSLLGTRDVLVMDGGRCFFDAYYSPSKRRIVWFMTHGVA